LRFASGSVRRPIGFRPPPDQIPSAARLDSVRRPIGFRPPSDENISRSMGKNVAEVSGLRSTKSNTNSVKTVTKTAPSVILSDTAQRRLSAKSLRNPIWHAICISVSENINQLK
jgi:hypothetical protein